MRFAIQPSLQGVMSTSLFHNMSLILPRPRLHNNNSWSIHRQRCLCGSCGIQHHMSRDPGTASPTHAPGDRQADLGPRCSPCWGPRTSTSPSQPWEPMKNAVLDNHLQSREPVKSRFPEEKVLHNFGAKNTSLDALPWVRGELWLYHITLLPGQPS